MKIEEKYVFVRLILANTRDAISNTFFFIVYL
jgi:hypothetical protein